MIFTYGFSIQGLKHESADVPCQDAHSIVELHSGWVVAAIADGLGSAARSDIAANIAVKTVTDIVSKYIPKMWQTETIVAILKTGFVAAQKAIDSEMEKHSHLPEEYDTTLTAVIYNGRKIVYGHVGDGGIIGLGSFGDYFKVTEVQKGEEHNVVVPLRGGPDYWIFDYSEEEFSSILLLTDGLLDIMLPSLLNGNIYINYVRQFMDIKKMGLTEANQKQIIDNLGSRLKSDDLDFVTDDKTLVGLINLELVPQDKEPSYYEEPNWDKLKEERRKSLYGDDEQSTSVTDTTVDQDVKVNVNADPEKEVKVEQVNKVEEKLGQEINHSHSSIVANDVGLQIENSEEYKKASPASDLTDVDLVNQTIPSVNAKTIKPTITRPKAQSKKPGFLDWLSSKIK